MSTRLKNRTTKTDAEKGIVSQPIMVVIILGSDCYVDWTKAGTGTIAEYKKYMAMLM